MIPLSSAVGEVIATKLTFNTNCGVTGDGNSNRGKNFDYLYKEFVFIYHSVAQFCSGPGILSETSEKT